MKGEWTDKVPVMLHNFLMAAKEAGYTQKEYREDPYKIAGAFIRSVDKYGFDGILVDIDTVTIAGALGVPVDFPGNEPARCLSSCINDLREVDDLDIPDISKNERVQIWLEAVAEIVRQVGNEIYVRGNCDQAPFSLASMMRSPVHWMMDLLDYNNQERVFRLLEYCSIAGNQFIRLMAETGAHMVSNGDSPAGPEMISPDMFRTFALPYEKKLADTAHELDLPYIMHICGNTDLILEDMLDSGADGLELDYKTDMLKAHSLMKDKSVFIGNIDPSGVLAFGTPQIVKEKTYELLKVFADTPNFILNAGCAIPAETPSENLIAMIETARNFR